MKKIVLLSCITFVGLLGCNDNRTAERTPPPSAPVTTSQAPQTTPSTEASKTMGLAEMNDTDRAFAQRIETDLRKDSALPAAAQNIQVYAQNGEVTLRGSVNNEQEKTTIGSAVQQMSGVSKVDNQIQVASVSR